MGGFSVGIPPTKEKIYKRKGIEHSTSKFPVWFYITAVRTTILTSNETCNENYYMVKF